MPRICAEISTVGRAVKTWTLCPTCATTRFRPTHQARFRRVILRQRLDVDIQAARTRTVMISASFSAPASVSHHCWPSSYHVFTPAHVCCMSVPCCKSTPMTGMVRKRRLPVSIDEEVRAVDRRAYHGTALHLAVGTSVSLAHHVAAYDMKAFIAPTSAFEKVESSSPSSLTQWPAKVYTQCLTWGESHAVQYVSQRVLC